MHNTSKHKTILLFIFGINGATIDMKRGDMRRAIILLSGGLDSITTIAIAKHEGFDCYALSFQYGQRHEH